MHSLLLVDPNILDFSVEEMARRGDRASMGVSAMGGLV